MTRTVELDRTTDVAATGAVAFTTSAGASMTKVPTHGQYHWTLTSIAKTAGGGAAATVLLKGTNNPDPADTSGETLITLTHTGATQQDGSAANKGYKYVFVHVTALIDLTIDRLLLFGTGYAGTH